MCGRAVKCGEGAAREHNGPVRSRRAASPLDRVIVSGTRGGDASRVRGCHVTDRVVTIEINGQRYPIRTQLDAAYVTNLAAYVEAKMALAARESPAGDTLKIAVLAALNIADECFRARDEGSQQRDTLSARAMALEAILDLALQDGGESPLARTAGSH